MGQRVRVRVEVWRPVVDGQGGPGGGGYEHLKATNRLVYRTAIRLSGAFSRTGDIKRSHVNAGVLRAGRASARASVNNTSDHALFKHDGTTGPIRPTNSLRLRLPSNGYSPRAFIYKKRVRGQAGDPWLYRAGVIAAARMGGDVRRGRASNGL